MRLAMLCPYDLDRPGGVQNQSVGLAVALLERGHEVVLVAPGTRPVESRRPIELALLGPTRSFAANGSMAPIAARPAAWRATWRLLARGHFELCHLQEPFVPGAPLAALLHSAAPLVGTFHRAGVDRTYRRLRPLLAPLARRLARVAAVSSEAAATLEAVTGRPPDAILANAVDLERFAGSAPPRERGRLLFVGRLEERKGLGVLLEALRELAGDWRLVIVGDGALGPSLRTEYQDRRITWLGSLSERALTRELQQAELLIAPSLGGESFGVILLEAMAAGCVVLASALPGYRLAAGEVARVVTAGDVPALRLGLAALLADKGERESRRAAGLARAAEFSFRSLAVGYEALYGAAVELGVARPAG